MAQKIILVGQKKIAESFSSFPVAAKRLLQTGDVVTLKSLCLNGQPNMWRSCLQSNSYVIFSLPIDVLHNTMYVVHLLCVVINLKLD